MQQTPTATDQQLRHWLALLETPGLGARGANRLLQQIGPPEQIFAEARCASPRMQLPASALDWLRQPQWERIAPSLQWLEQPTHHLLTLDDNDYPRLLKQLADPPLLLFVQGNKALLNAPQLAIVGSRNPTASGRQTARDFASHLANAGIAITSGLAIGIDGAAHQGALQGDGYTLGVTATGLDRVYPARHRELAHQIAADGALVSEFPPGTAVRRDHFPRRNRIISGLSLGTLVVEAAVRSGSLITARLASEQGREVFAIPGSIHNPLARGCHRLIRQGAKLVETATDIIEELGPLLGQLQPPEQQHDRPPATLPDADPEYRQLLQCLGFDPLPVDLLVERSGLTAEAVSSMLLLLELEGYVLSAPGGRYTLSGTAPPSSNR